MRASNRIPLVYKLVDSISWCKTHLNVKTARWLVAMSCSLEQEGLNIGDNSSTEKLKKNHFI